MKSVHQKSGGFVMAILMGAMICSVSASAGSVLYTTLGPNGEYDGTQDYLIGGRGPVQEVVANEFTLNAGATVGDAVLALGYFLGLDPPMDVYIESNNGGLPGSIIASLTQVGTIPPWFGTGGGLVTFNCSGAQCTLGAGSYWLVAFQPDSNSQDLWAFAYQDQPNNMAYKRYNLIGSGIGPWNGFFASQGAFRIDGASGTTPEPGSVILLGSGLLGVAGVVRRRLNFLRR
jgi:hypothetical protein